MLKSVEQRHDDAGMHRYRFRTRGHLTVVRQASSQTMERAEHLRTELRGHGIATKLKVDLDGSAWIRFTYKQRAYDIVCTRDHGHPHCLILTFIDHLDTQHTQSRYHALERINSANLRTKQGGLVLTALGNVNAVSALDTHATASQILATLGRLKSVIQSYEHGG